ncbi:hypothetical protein HPB48_022364 [Haemaphysalis longicornis]|uniref:Copper homeostasis protein cutC homolog n=1 Tax=Haemaphysalis longicornis TaxID=44386 RepID=A0A9J6H413_HAELO|nr:hypothetical protein HPB48_022364 [Haemaphysalis longicornis]
MLSGRTRAPLAAPTCAGTFVAVRQRCPALPVMVLVRPRAGDFCFSPEEVEAMETDIRLFRQHGASGFVLGALTRCVNQPPSTGLFCSEQISFRVICST